MATPKRTRATSSTSTTRSKKATTTSQAQEPTTLSSQHQPQANGNVESAIRFRAYQLYIQRGGVHGADLEDWLRAESEIRQGSAV